MNFDFFSITFYNYQNDEIMNSQYEEDLVYEDRYQHMKKFIDNIYGVLINILTYS